MVFGGLLRACWRISRRAAGRSLRRCVHRRIVGILLRSRPFTTRGRCRVHRGLISVLPCRAGQDGGGSSQQHKCRLHVENGRVLVQACRCRRWFGWERWNPKDDGRGKTEVDITVCPTLHNFVSSTTMRGLICMSSNNATSGMQRSVGSTSGGKQRENAPTRSEVIRGCGEGLRGTSCR